MRALEKKQDFSAIPGIAYRHNGNLTANLFKRIADLDAIPFPVRSKADMEIGKEYLPSNVAFSEQRFATLITSRGCNHSCRMCENAAIWGSEKISRSQIRKFKRYGVIPANFIRYLKNIGAIEREKFVPEKYRTVYWLLDLLWETPNRNKADRSEGECIRVEILKDMMP